VSYITTDGQSASLSCNKAPILVLRPDNCGPVDVGCPLWQEDGSVVYNCSWPLPVQTFSGPTPMGLVTIFTVSDSRLPFSSPPTTRRVTVEVFDPASTRELNLLSRQSQSHVTTDTLSVCLILRPTVSRSVCLGIKPPSGAYDQIFITVRQLLVC
jgi:hypothetical protein